MALILGLESSCDDSAVALVDSDRRILAHAVVSQNAAHQPFGGVVPEIAARAHVEILPPLIRQVLDEAGAEVGDVDAIAATAGPGLIGGVMVALLAGKGLALATGKPLIAVNHLEGHALSPRLVDPDLEFPYLLLLVSGGHCQLLEVRGPGGTALIAVKLLRGVANILTGWAELPKQVHHLWVHEGWVRGVTRGPIDGLGMLFARTLAGAYETVSFPLPVPPSYRPLLEPPYVWQAEAPPEGNNARSSP